MKRLLLVLLVQKLGYGTVRAVPDGLGGHRPQGSNRHTQMWLCEKEHTHPNCGTEYNTTDRQTRCTGSHTSPAHASPTNELRTWR
jgi:hypothetical protein